MSNGMTFIQAAGATVVLSILTLSPQAGATDLLIQGGTVVTAEGSVRRTSGFGEKRSMRSDLSSELRRMLGFSTLAAS